MCICNNIFLPSPAVGVQAQIKLIFRFFFVADKSSDWFVWNKDDLLLEKDLVTNSLT